MNEELKTIPQLSRLLRLSQKQIRDYVAEGCPVAIRAKAPNPHRINTADFFHWCIERRDADNRLRRKAIGGPVDEAKARSAAALAEKHELELAMMRNELFYFVDLVPFIQDKIVETRQAFGRIPAEIRPRFGDELADAVDELITQHLNAYAHGIKGAADNVKPAQPGGRNKRRD